MRPVTSQLTCLGLVSMSLPAVHSSAMRSRHLNLFAREASEKTFTWLVALLKTSFEAGLGTSNDIDFATPGQEDAAAPKLDLREAEINRSAAYDAYAGQAVLLTISAVPRGLLRPVSQVCVLGFPSGRILKTSRACELYLTSCSFAVVAWA